MNAMYEDIQRKVGDILLIQLAIKPPSQGAGQ